MKGTIGKRFEELDWDNNGKTLLHVVLLFNFVSTCSRRCATRRPTSTSLLQTCVCKRTL